MDVPLVISQCIAGSFNILLLIFYLCVRCPEEKRSDMLKEGRSAAAELGGTGE